MPISLESLKPFKRDVFVETGTYDGDGVSVALAAGFKEIWTIELNPARYEACKQKFAAFPNVHVLFGDSVEKISEVLAKLTGPATLWLDAHGEPGHDDPLIGELSAIVATGVKNHVLLMDDMWETDYASQTRMDLLRRVREVNPAYDIFWIGTNPGDTNKTIMVAQEKP